MDLDDVEVVDVRALGGLDSVTVGDVAGTDLQRVDVALAGALGGSVGDGQPDSVTVTGTDGDDAFVAVANGSSVEIGGADAVVGVTGADPLLDRLVIDSGLGDDSVSIDPAVDALILVSVL